MLRKVLAISVVSLFFTNVFAQQDESSNTYVENMQKKFDSANADASAQFSKTYPAPHISSQSPSAPAVQQAPPPPPPPQQFYTPAPQPASKVPDISVNPDKSGSSSANNNIYAPGGNTQNGNNTTNPYR